MEQDWLQQRLGKLDGQLEALESKIERAGGAYLAALAGSPEEAKYWNREYDRLVEGHLVRTTRAGGQDPRWCCAFKLPATFLQLLFALG